MTDAERKNKEIYERIVRVKKEFREFLDKRQDYLEKKKKMVLGKKNWNQPSQHFKEYMDYLEEKKAQIHELKKAFDWGELKQREVRYVHQRNQKMRERKETDFVKSRKLNFYKNKQSYDRVQSLDMQAKSKFTDPSKLYKKRQMYSHLVSEKFKPARSEVNIEKTLHMQAELNSSIINLKKRRQNGLINLSKSRDYLAYSRKIGKEKREKRKQRRQMSMSSSTPYLHKSIGTEPIKKNYLTESKKFTTPILNRKREKLTKNIFLKKPKVKYLNTSDKGKLEAEMGHMDREAKWKQYRLDKSPKKGVDKLLQAQEADTILIKAMVAKCLYNDSNVMHNDSNDFKPADGTHPNKSKSVKVKDDFAWRKRRYKVTNKALDKYRTSKGQPAQRVTENKSSVRLKPMTKKPSTAQVSQNYSKTNVEERTDKMMSVPLTNDQNKPKVPILNFENNELSKHKSQKEQSQALQNDPKKAMTQVNSPHSVNLSVLKNNVKETKKQQIPVQQPAVEPEEEF